jgi:hypothetical protein
MADRRNIKKRSYDADDINVHELRSSPNAWKKYGWKGGILTALITGAPFLFNEWDAYKEAERNLVIENLMLTNNKELVLAMDKVADRVIKEQRISMETAINAHSKLKIGDSDMLYIAEKAVAMQSIIKVKELKEAFLEAQLTDKELLPHEKNRLEKEIKYILVSNSRIYVEDLNRFIHPKLGTVGDYIWNEFPMASFLKHINEIVFAGYPDVDYIADSIMDYMIMEAQPKFFDKMKSDMK